MRTRSGRLLFQHDVATLCLRLGAAWLLLSAAVLLAGAGTVASLLPLFDRIASLAQTDFVGSLAVVKSGRDSMIQLTPFTLRVIPLQGGWIVPAGVELRPVRTHVIHTFVPVVVLLTPLLGWPARKVAELPVRLLLGLCALLTVLAVTTPLLLVGHVHMNLARAAIAAGAAFREPFLITFVLFMEGGGRWLLPLVLAIACIAAAHRMTGGSSAAVPSCPDGATRATPLAFPPVPGG